MQIKITEHWKGGSREAAVIDLDHLIRYVRYNLTEADAEAMRQSLEETGRATVRGESTWFEYQRIDPK
ncbi:hypothetical protein GCM10011390_41450 [Aureimonas endophytica]|uniref:Uncharacterized protein n=1 Tax=Aureimonas endophytica TaxID=2027858 RepID=A0A916ZYM4_9HYPH|nr:hypothetical protein GCM10011390_41450 [Aureimonas endophytica]